MNPEGDNKLPSEKKANENNDDEHQELDQSMSDDEETNKSPTDLSLRQRQQQLSASIPQSTNSSRTNQTSEMVCSAAKDLIERYFYQLQRGCGNPKCTNVNCASSGELAPMTANEMAARAIQLLSLDAKLCDDYSQPSKVPRTDSHYDSPTSSSHVNHHTPLPIAEDVNTYNQQLDHSSAGSTSNSAITSSPYTSTHSTSSTGSSNTNISSCSTEEMPLIVALDENTTVKQSVANTVQQETNSLTNSSWETSDSPRPTFEPVEYLNEQILDDMIEKCKKQNNYDLLVHAISEVFPSIQKLSKSFRRRRPLVKMTSTATASKLQEILGKSPQELKKEDLRTLEGEHDKDEDSSYSCLQKPLQIRGLDFYSSQRFNSLPRAVSRNSGDVGGDGDGYGAVIEPMDEDCFFDDTVDRAQSSHTMVDVESLGRVKRKLHDVKEVSVAEALNDNIILFSGNVPFDYSHDWEEVLHCFVVCFDMLLETRHHYADLLYLEGTLHRLCMVIDRIPVMAQARLARIWSTHYKDQLHSIVYLLQQIISLKIILEEEELEDYFDVMSLTQALKIAYYANILAGEIDTYDNQQENNAASSSARDDDDIFNYKRIEHVYHDELETALGVSRIDCSVPFIPYEEFYNEPLSDYIQMDKDYLSYKKMTLNPSTRENYFSYMFYSFILTPATKVIALYYDSRVRMFSEQATIQAIMNYVDGNDGRVLPNLKLKVRRDNIVNDALIGLELAATSNPKNLKKQLVVEFIGEHGIDEGGVSKEFFQLIVEEIFNPDFGMFTHQEETNTMWFNTTPFENGAQFTLIGIILGLAIYNNIILAVNFPRVVYRKLMGGRGSFYDLKDWSPTLYRSLKSLLEYQENDMEEVFMQTFKISYKNVFDEVVEHELKPGGGDIAVNQENKQEFVNLYSDYLLNKSIERQFKAFKKGFDMATDESPLKLLFTPDEIELLVCGSRNFDFMELEESTTYEGGYTKNTQIIKDFWSIVHILPEESKRKLLQFTTGSDRVPVGGLKHLKLIITRNGPDSDRLPTAHTCFNVLLLSEYSSKEKLEDRLLKAINYSKGFGML